MTPLWALVWACSFFTSLDTMTAGLITAAVADSPRDQLALALLAVAREVIAR